MSEKNYSVSGPNFEEYIVCPYDRVHRILPVRLTYHLTRCAKNFPSSKMVHCPFNTTHLHSVANMQRHVIECPNRSSLERYKLPDMLPPVEPRSSEFIVETTEDWDAEPPTPTYNPQRYCEKEFIIRNPQGAPPAARREFRERERRRFLENNQF
ncbi:gametocyte-specific factor 1 homolog [Drosophila rhopaloa]|uniref:Gametocyte-specific factor 1 homolog n=1 Tax=Drosophila rhopaloa TaxID=1041015 RepID=A0A6P4E9E1_DRORH|nr:gametocyte-specific factor 1 homolog [Drosophila rhopaloa]